MKANTFNLWLPLALLLVATSLQGGIVAPQSILELERTADLIVNGTATVIVQNGTRSDFSLRVSRVIKGDGAVAGDSIGVYWVSGNQATAGNGGNGDVGGSGIWFLQRTSGAWRVIPDCAGDNAIEQSLLSCSARSDCKRVFLQSGSFRG